MFMFSDTANQLSFSATSNNSFALEVSCILSCCEVDTPTTGCHSNSSISEGGSALSVSVSKTACDGVFVLMCNDFVASYIHSHSVTSSAVYPSVTTTPDCMVCSPDAVTVNNFASEFFCLLDARMFIFFDR